MAIPPTTLATEAVPAAITLEAMTSGAGIGISPKKGILNVAIASSVDKVLWLAGLSVLSLVLLLTLPPLKMLSSVAEVPDLPNPTLPVPDLEEVEDLNKVLPHRG